MTTLRDIYKTAAKNIRAMSVDDAKAFTANRTVGIGQDSMRALTGGYSSQAIDFQVLRAIGIRARGNTVTIKDFIV